MLQACCCNESFWQGFFHAGEPLSQVMVVVLLRLPVYACVFPNKWCPISGYLNMNVKARFHDVMDPNCFPP